MDFITGLLAAAAVGALFVGRQWYHEQLIERAASRERYRSVEAQLAAMRAVVCTQGDAIADVNSRAARLGRPQGDTPPWLS